MFFLELFRALTRDDKQEAQAEERIDGCGYKKTA
jgi:hypothetical protein